MTWKLNWSDAIKAKYCKILSKNASGDEVKWYKAKSNWNHWHAYTGRILQQNNKNIIKLYNKINNE